MTTAAPAVPRPWIRCSVCGRVPTRATTTHGLTVAMGNHRRKHRGQADVEPVVPEGAELLPSWRTTAGGTVVATPDLDAGPALAVLSRAASLRLSVAAARARIRMWQANPAMDRARNANQVLAEVLELLDEDER